MRKTATKKTPIQKVVAPIKPPLTMSEAMRQLGTLGLNRVGPYIRGEYLRELWGSQGRAKFREMYNNDVVRRGVRAIKLPMLAATWTAEEAEGPDAEAAQEFLLQCTNDMIHTWYRFLDEALTGTIVYGAHWFQTLYKRRRGPDIKDPLLRSEYDDGLWGWKEFSPRGQETWDGWEFDDDGHMIGLRQNTDAGLVIVPLDRSVHFTIEGKMGDPNGESLLRAAYEPWYGLKHADYWIAILSEKMGGFPITKIEDPSLSIFNAADPNMAALRTYLENAGTAFRLDEQMSALIPAGVDFKVAAPPIKISDLENYIRLCSWRILGSLLAQFLELGQAPQGSYAKSQSDKEFFLLALEAILGHAIAETLNVQEVPRLFGMNAGSFRLDKLPRLVPSDMQVPALADLAGPLKELADGMIIRPGPALEKHVRNLGDLPEEEEETEEETPALPGGPPTEPGEEEAGSQHWTASDL